jgi:hypothetical protein
MIFSYSKSAEREINQKIMKNKYEMKTVGMLGSLSHSHIPSAEIFFGAKQRLIVWSSQNI